MAPIEPQNTPGLVRVRSNHSVDETIAKITAILTGKGVKLFALIDHSGEAAGAGLLMPPTKLLIFGNPAGGTPVMLARPSAAIDLPLKILVAEDEAGVWISYNAVEYLAERHRLPADLLAKIGAAEPVATAAGQ